MQKDSAARYGGRSAIYAHEGSNQLLPQSSSRKTDAAWSLTIRERRASPRVETHLPTIVHGEDRRWKGESRSIGLSGMALVVVGNVPAFLNQQIRLSFCLEAAGLLSLGIVCGIRTDQKHLSETIESGTIMAVQFVHLSDGDEKVVTSLLAEGKNWSGEACITAALIQQDSNDVLIDVDSGVQVMASKPPTRLVEKGQWPQKERRRHRRIEIGAARTRRLLSDADADSVPSIMKHAGSSAGASPKPTQPQNDAEREERREISSDFLTCFRSSGERIALCHDRPKIELADDAPIVILAPGYGESKRDYVPLAYYLVANGFHVVRYDNVNHVGESDGVVTQFRLKDMERDLETVLNYVTATWPERPVGLVATSLAGRVALKVTSETTRLKLLVLINAILDVRHTLQAVHQEDLIGEHMAGIWKGVVNILGLTIDADRWLSHAIQGEYADLATTKRDVECLRTPLVLFHAEQDAWVDPASIQTVVTAASPYLQHSYVVPDALHRLQESPRKARMVYRQIAMSCWEALWLDRPLAQLVEPSHREIGVQNRIERDRGKNRRSMKKSDQVAFWKDYLLNFQTIPNVVDFWRLMDHVYRLMGDCHGGERILDAGCGNGNFGVFLQLNQAFRQRYARRGQVVCPPDYIGVDFVPAALAQATVNFTQVEATLEEQFHESLRGYRRMPMQLFRADLESPLPFPD
ncbi:MAG TPA: alpha/beta fold hydrolase, partial [Nitrospira sp.]|nr:alpha/beta fold hydrolase [Nitrospira sp.]